MQMITVKQIQAKMAEAIEQSTMTKAEIAQALNISVTSLNKYITGDKLPPIGIFAAFCQLLKLDANYILCQK